jgi:hypothetical protein
MISAGNYLGNRLSNEERSRCFVYFDLYWTTRFCYPSNWPSCQKSPCTLGMDALPHPGNAGEVGCISGVPCVEKPNGQGVSKGGHFYRIDDTWKELLLANIAAFVNGEWPLRWPRYLPSPPIIKGIFLDDCNLLPGYLVQEMDHPGWYTKAAGEDSCAASRAWPKLYNPDGSVKSDGDHGRLIRAIIDEIAQYCCDHGLELIVNGGYRPPGLGYPEGDPGRPSCGVRRMAEKPGRIATNSWDILRNGSKHDDDVGVRKLRSGDILHCNVLQHSITAAGDRLVTGKYGDWTSWTPDDGLATLMKAVDLARERGAVVSISTDDPYMTLIDPKAVDKR